MNSERIKEIQQKTAYPDSASVQQALLQVWNECSKPKAKALVWEEFEGNRNNNVVNVGDVNMVFYSLTNHLCIYVSGNQRFSKSNFNTFNEAKQAAQEWYDNYVSEFIKENTEQ